MKKLYVYADFDWLKEIELIGELGYESLRGSDSYSFTFCDEWLKKYRVLFIVDDPSRQFYFVLGGDVQGHKGQQEKAEYGFEKSCLHFVVCLLTLFK